MYLVTWPLRRSKLTFIGDRLYFPSQKANLSKLRDDLYLNVWMFCMFTTVTLPGELSPYLKTIVLLYIFYSQRSQTRYFSKSIFGNNRQVILNHHSIKKKMELETKICTTLLMCIGTYYTTIRYFTVWRCLLLQLTFFLSFKCAKH